MVAQAIQEHAEFLASCDKPKKAKISPPPPGWRELDNEARGELDKVIKEARIHGDLKEKLNTASSLNFPFEEADNCKIPS